MAGDYENVLESLNQLRGDVEALAELVDENASKAKIKKAMSLIRQDLRDLDLDLF
jgi:macrodomain Ter protein organizer (MatP/YcbG family)